MFGSRRAMRKPLCTLTFLSKLLLQLFFLLFTLQAKKYSQKSDIKLYLIILIDNSSKCVILLSLSIE